MQDRAGFSDVRCRFVYGISASICWSANATGQRLLQLLVMHAGGSIYGLPMSSVAAVNGSLLRMEGGRVRPHRRVRRRLGGHDRCVRAPVASLALAFLAASLWLAASAEHEYTSIRAPWTGMTLVASGLAFVAAGYIGRGWRALLGAAVAAPAAVILAGLVVWQGDQVDPGTVESCDPGCIPTGAGVILAAGAAMTLALVGVVLRQARALTRGTDAASASDEACRASAGRRYQSDSSRVRP
jgi:hypothetical protein